MAELLVKYNFDQINQGNRRVVEGSVVSIVENPPVGYLTNPPPGYFTVSESKERWLNDPAETAEELARRNQGNAHTEFNDDPTRPFIVLKVPSVTATELASLAASNVLTRPPQAAHPFYPPGVGGADEPELQDPDGVEQVPIIGGPVSAPGIPGDDRVYWPAGTRYLDRNEEPTYILNARRLSTGRLNALTRDGFVVLTFPQLQALTEHGYTGEQFTLGV
jgi:hypothetical protein